MTNQVENFSIILQKPDNQAVYNPGDVLIGFLNFRVVQYLNIKSVRLVIDGTARVKWAEGKGKKKRLYGSVDNYFRDKQTFLEREIGSTDLMLERGDYSFNFKFNLPPNLPSSFEGENCRIRYSLNATIAMATSPNENKHATRAFTVVNKFDLSSLPKLKKPAENQEAVKASSSCFPCRSGQVTGELHVNKTGFVPGETIICSASLVNQSSREAKPMTVSLVQQVFCHGRRFGRQIKQYDRDVAEAHYATTVAPRSHVDWTNVALPVPPVCPSTSPHESRAVEVFYALVLRFQTVGMRVCKEVSIPIVIGTRPTHFNPKRSEIYLYQPSRFETPNSELLPDEYDESMRGVVVHSNAKSFRPFYPYFPSLAT